MGNCFLSIRSIFEFFCRHFEKRESKVMKTISLAVLALVVLLSGIAKADPTGVYAPKYEQGGKRDALTPVVDIEVFVAPGTHVSGETIKIYMAVKGQVASVKSSRVVVLPKDPITGKVYNPYPIPPFPNLLNPATFGLTNEIVDQTAIRFARDVSDTGLLARIVYQVRIEGLDAKGDADTLLAIGDSGEFSFQKIRSIKIEFLKDVSAPLSVPAGVTETWIMKVTIDPVLPADVRPDFTALMTDGPPAFPVFGTLNGDGSWDVRIVHAFQSGPKFAPLLTVDVGGVKVSGLIDSEGIKVSVGDLNIAIHGDGTTTTTGISPVKLLKQQLVAPKKGKEGKLVITLKIPALP